MDSSGTERGDRAPDGLPERVGAAFSLLMQVRMLIAAITLLLIPRVRLVPQTFVLVTCVVLLSWLAANYWELLVPWLLRHPILMAADLCVSFAVLGIGGTSGPFFLSTVITGAVAGLLYRWRGVAGVSAAQIVLYYATFAFSPANEPAVADSFQALVGQPCFYPLAGFAGTALHRLFDDQERLAAARRRAEVAAAAAEERARLAREMHDSLAKTLRGIALSAAALPGWVERDPGRGIEEAARIAAATEIASREARHLLTDLRAQAVQRSLPQAVAEIAGAWSREHGVPVVLDLAPDADLPPLARYEAVAILSEALANVARHAGAGSVRVRSFVDEDDGVVLEIADDGRGFAPPGLPALARAGHYGVVGLHERAARVGGAAAVRSAPGAGTTVTVRLPLEEPVEHPVEVS
ncbi:Sensor histidine kinase LiaS [Actinomadura rubteroloni]|uniref:Sensor histidine kinase LiaS n=1 Tax=Actinomadura rubteroloni TaxID=1926885 RepID=A0A2P4UJ74_9ACTN|nr:histidine kinase [Actinomadura rubteroloni]POM25058.1 Sensor histidine kinase LiaS [Actinomadura rubteroloni]